MVLKKYRFGHDDVKRISIVGSTGSAKSFVDVRITDLRIRADAIPAAPESALITVAAQKGDKVEVAAQAAPESRASKIWLVASAFVIITVFFVLGAVFLLTRRATPKQPRFILFACPKCNEAISAAGTMIGQKVKCSKCGKSVTVPASEQLT